MKKHNSEIIELTNYEIVLYWRHMLDPVEIIVGYEAHNEQLK